MRTPRRRSRWSGRWLPARARARNHEGFAHRCLRRDGAGAGVHGQFALLAQLGNQGLAIALWSLLGGHVVSRFWPLIAVRTLPHVGDTATSKSKPLADQITTGALITALLWCVIPVPLFTLALGWQAALAAIVCSGIGAVRCSGDSKNACWASRRLLTIRSRWKVEIAFYLGVIVAGQQGIAPVLPWQAL